jgi:hypothetical protein
VDSNRQIEISVQGQWRSVPSVQCGAYDLVAFGRWVRTARVHDEVWLARAVEDPNACMQSLRSRSGGSLRADVFTFAQRVSAPQPKYDYSMELESIAAIRLSNAEAWWDKLPQATRKNARRAGKRGVVVSVQPLDDTLARQIVDINNDSPTRQGKRFTHFGKSVEQVKKDHSAFSDRSEFICAHVGDELIGFLKIVYCDRIGAILQLTTKASQFDRRPANALIVKAVERCAEKDISFITYGKFRYGNQEHTSLMEFKERNGFEEILVPRYYVPLTVKGRFAMRLNLHRDLIEIVPQPVLMTVRRLRTALRQWKQPHTAPITVTSAESI